MSGIWLVRHGETMTPGLFLGTADPPLSDAGRREARLLAARFAAIRPARVIASGLRRAAETAQALAAACAVDVEADERLNELGYGEWDGLSWDEIERRWPSAAAAKLADWWSVTPAGGEPTEVFLARVDEFWRELSADDRRPVAVVAHLGVNALLAELARCGGADQVSWDRVTAFQQPLGDALEL